MRNIIKRGSIFIIAILNLVIKEEHILNYEVVGEEEFPDNYLKGKYAIYNYSQNSSLTHSCYNLNIELFITITPLTGLHSYNNGYIIPSVIIPHL